MSEHLADLQNQLANVSNHQHLRGGNRLVHVRQGTQSEAHRLAASILRLRNQVMARSTIKRRKNSH